MKKELKVLQVASFQGNVGDNANHNGTRVVMQEVFSDFTLKFTNLEIRDFFWKKKVYDESFADLVNQHDLTLFGGGNFFEIWVEDSCNGTSVDIPIPILKKINKPIIFYALGLDPLKGVPKQNPSKLRGWLDYVYSKPEQFIVSLRNDGSKNNAENVLGKTYAEAMYKIPDGGFFTTVDEGPFVEIPENKKVIGINIAGDMLELRFPKKDNRSIDFKSFSQKLTKYLNNLLSDRDDIDLLLFCHIYKDVNILKDYLSDFDEWHLRQRIRIAPYLHGFGAEEHIFGLYNSCAVVSGFRFHTNVCSIGLGVPTIALGTYKKIEDTYQELNLSERIIYANQNGFIEHFDELLHSTLSNPNSVRTLYKSKTGELRQELIDFHKYVKSWLLE